MAAFAGSDQEKLKALSQRPYKEQAIWFLNAFWGGESGPQFGTNEEEAENIWKALIVFRENVQFFFEILADFSRNFWKFKFQRIS